jgi:ribonuclease Z
MRFVKGVLIGLLSVAAIGLGGFGVAWFVPQAQDALVDRMARSAMSRNADSLLRDDALRAVVCGSSSPVPSPAAKACIAVIAGGKFYIVDIGPGAYNNMATWRWPLDRIGGVFLTHFHSDHIGDLGELNMNSWAQGRAGPLDVYGPPGVAQVVAGYAQAYALDQGYRTAHHGAALLNADRWAMVPHPVPLEGPATAAFDRRAVVLDDGALKITAIEVRHTPVEPAYAYRFDYKGRSLVVSGDTRRHPPLARAAQGADVLFHEAQAQPMVRRLHDIAEEIGNHRLGHILSDIQRYHTSPVEAAGLANDAKVKLLVFYHFTPPVPNLIAERVFTRGVADVRPAGWLMSRDGTLIELPLGGQAVHVRQIAP